MTDKVQKIREEVARIQLYTQSEVLNQILDFIDSLQEEPVSKDFEMALAEMIDKAQKCVVAPWVVAAQWKDELIKLASEESVSEELGEYINELSKQFPEVSFAKLSRIAVRVAKWQKQKDEKAINENALLYNARLEGIEIGKAEMKQQMMVKAVETTFNVSLTSGLYDKLWIKGCKEGDKLLVIKKDEL